MKNLVLFLILLFSTIMHAQEQKSIPMINVSGEGKIKVTPDQACISISQETKGSNAVIVKKDNDSKIDLVLKFIKKMKIASEDFQTTRVTLTPNFNYETKKQEFIATQSVSILLKDLKNYDVLMNGLLESGINKIDNVEFKSTKILQLQSEARKLAIKDAKIKAEDYVSVLDQKVGKVFTISDNSQNALPHPVMYAMKSTAFNDGVVMQNDTLAAGQIEIVVNVNVSFVLE